MAIQNLNQGTPTVASSIPFYDAANGRDARCSITELAALILAGLSSAGITPQYSSPNVSGYAVTIAPPADGASMWLVLTPVADYANLTINLPIGVDGQEISVSSTHAVSGALTVTGATVGAAPQPVNGAPATLVANGYFRLRFDGVASSWYRVG
jgi:hypothetical protein